MYLDSMNIPSLQKKKVTENRGSENIWLKIRARHKLTTRIFDHFLPITSSACTATSTVQYIPCQIHARILPARLGANK